MAKIIRCPNCGENVEVPANPTGQIVTCVACGTAMRLKSKKDAGDKPRGDSSHGSLSGSLSGSMTATRITDQVQASSDDPPNLGGECEVCGKPVDPSELVEDRGHMTCRDCIKGARSSRPRAAAKFSDSDLIPFAGPTGGGPRRANVITIGMPFYLGAAALVLYVACDLFLSLNPKPIGKGVIAKTDEPAPTSQSAWESENRERIINLLKEATVLKADPTRSVDALEKYDAIVAMAKGQSIGSQEVRGFVDEAEREAEALRVAMSKTPSAGTPPPPPPPTEVAANLPPPAPGEAVPDNIASAPNSVFDDPEVAITDKLNAGVTSLEAAIAAEGPAAEPLAKEALIRFSEARNLLIREKRNFPEDVGWTLSNHGTAIGYLLSRNYGYALDYLKRLPQPPDRAALLNHVVVLLQMREDKGEAIRMLLEHLQSPAGAEDTYALNLLGTTLARYSPDVIRQTKPLSDAQERYEELEMVQGAKHPGEKRWGVRWVTINEWNALDKQRRIEQNNIENREKALTKLRYRINNARLPHQKQQLPADQAEEARLVAEIEAIRAKMPTEEWLTPEQIVPILPDVTAVNARSRAATQPAATGG